jgi:hypothetical protein
MYYGMCYYPDIDSDAYERARRRHSRSPRGP